MPEFTIQFTALTDGDDLGCSKKIQVAWEKPNPADEAKLTLDCGCTKHPNDPDQDFQTSTTDGKNTGTHDFTLNHPNPTDETGVKLIAKILHANVEQHRDQRISLFAQC